MSSNRIGTTTETDCPSHIEARERLIEIGPDAYIRVWKSGDYTIIHTVAAGSETTVSLDPHQAWTMVPPPEPNPEWEAKAAAAHAAIAAEVGGEPAATLKMLETWKADAQPADNQGRISFTRAMLDSAEDAIRTLLATPTQEGVGREEIETAIRVEFGRWNKRNGNKAHCSVQFIDQLTDLFLSLLPAPKPGEGE